jgi:hypothetical protein
MAEPDNRLLTENNPLEAPEVLEIPVEALPGPEAPAGISAPAPAPDPSLGNVNIGNETITGSRPPGASDVNASAAGPSAQASPTPGASAPDRPADQERAVTLPEVLAYSAVIGLVSLLLGVGISLGILGLLNGGMNYASSQGLRSLQADVKTIQGQVTTLRQDTDGLRKQVDALSPISGRVAALEKESGALRNQIDQNSQRIAQAQVQLDSVSQQAAKLEQRTQAFDSFLAGLRDLLQSVAPPAAANP